MNKQKWDHIKALRVVSQTVTPEKQRLHVGKFGGKLNWKRRSPSTKGW